MALALIMHKSKKTKYCIALQPICDASMCHVADELLYRANDTATRAQFDDHQLATARVCNIAFYETGLKSLVGSRKLFVNIPLEWLFKPDLLPPYPEQMIIEVQESVVGTPDVIAALHKIRALGYQIALDDFVLTPETRPLLDVADIVKIDVLQPFDETSLSLYKDRGIRLLAEKVEELDTFIRLRDQGFEFFQGYFYAKPETQRLTSGDRTNNHTALTRLLSELHREDINYQELEELITQDAQLTYMLLKYTNSALFHHGGTVLTINQALSALGIRRIRVVTMTVLLAKNGPASRVLLAQALTRAAMCEQLAHNTSDSADVAFTAGLISMMGVLLGEPLPELLTKLPLPQSTADAILLRHHSLGKLLDAVESFENADINDWTPKKVERFNDAWLKSYVWTTQMLTTINVA